MVPCAADVRAKPPVTKHGGRFYNIVSPNGKLGPAPESPLRSRRHEMTPAGWQVGPFPHLKPTQAPSERNSARSRVLCPPNCHFSHLSFKWLRLNLTRFNAPVGCLFASVMETP